MSRHESGGTSRNEFLKQAAGATIVVAGAAAGAGAVAQRAAAGTGIQRYFPSHFALELDGIRLGPLAAASGGDPRWDVVLPPVGSDNIQRKDIRNIRTFSDLTIQIGSAMGKPMYDWIQNSFDNKYSRKNGAIVAADYNFKELTRLEFYDALITEVTVPSLNGATSSAGTIIVKFSPGSVSNVPAAGNQMSRVKHKPFLTQNFSVDIDGLDTSRVASIDSFTWKQRVSDDGSPPVTDAGDLGIVFDPASLPSWQQWYDNFAVGGDATDERSAQLTVAGAPGGGVLTVGLFNLGLHQLKDDWVNDPSGQNIRRVKAEMYCERASWDLKTAK